jgi:hypothetical protein
MSQEEERLLQLLVIVGVQETVADFTVIQWVGESRHVTLTEAAEQACHCVRRELCRRQLQLPDCGAPAVVPERVTLNISLRVLPEGGAE